MHRGGRGGHGHGHGHRGGRRRRRVMNFLRPCLLLILHQGEAHGYTLLSRLGDFGFDPELLDPSLVYRALREMEADELLASEWGSESLGPQRRVYRITAEGEEALEEWVADLRRTRREIDRLLRAYEALSRRADREAAAE